MAAYSFVSSQRYRVAAIDTTKKKKKKGHYHINPNFGRGYPHESPSDERPREKIQKYGPSVLAMRELISIIFNANSQKEDVLSLSSRLIREHGEHILKSAKNPKTLAKEIGVSELKAAQLVACAEIGRRLFSRQRPGLATIREPSDVFDYVKDMRGLPKEQLHGLYLNVQNQIIHDEMLSIGTVDTNLVHPREVFKPAIDYSAAGIILVHNHPSGDLTPSKEDMEITKQLKDVSAVVGIELLDHVIVTEHSYYSILLNADTQDV